MNLDLTPHLPNMRQTAESLMVDTVVIDRQTGTERNEETGGNDPVYGDPIYGPDVATDDDRNGRAQIQQQVSVSDEDQGAGQVVTILRRILKLPISATGLQVDDRVRVVDSAWDPDLPGRTFRISSLHGKTYATSRRVSIEEVT